MVASEDDVTKTFSPREFLRERQALLVHFSTIMATCMELVFPRDLRKAMALSGVPLSFSTIQRGDTNPFMEGSGGAEGSIGIVVDIGPITVVTSVSAGDSGSNPKGSLGVVPNEQSCADSIDRRLTSNEWRVQDYQPVGIFILPPIVVRQVSNVNGDLVAGEVGIDLAHAIAPFLDKRIFSANRRTFLELDRVSGEWRSVGYDDIIPTRAPIDGDGIDKPTHPDTL
jgi:hypothetical protein